MDDSPFPTATQQGSDSAAEVLLRALKAHGVDYMFANPGTDFAPLIEGLARGKHKKAEIPKVMVITHENCAVGMAHGYYMVSGKPQAVMVHTNVGTANTLNCLADACRENVPILLMAGRNPITEQGVLGSRNGPIHWGQEMFDQAGMLREFVKWDYEMRLPMQAEDLVARALEVDDGRAARLGLSHPAARGAGRRRSGVEPADGAARASLDAVSRSRCHRDARRHDRRRRSGR